MIRSVCRSSAGLIRRRAASSSSSLLLSPLVVQAAVRSFHLLTKQHALPSCPSKQFSLSHTQRRGFASFPDHIVLTMPALSPTMEKGNLATWKVKVGDAVKPGQVMAEVETDKATVAFESVESGFIAKILIEQGTADVPVGTPVAVLAESADDVAAFAAFAVGGSASAPEAAPKEAQPAAAAAAAPAAEAAPAAAAPAGPTTPAGRVVASPAARRVANEKGVTIEALQGTGPNSRIVQADVLEAAAAPKKAPVAAAVAPAAAAQPQAAAKPAPIPSSIPAPAVGDFIDIPHTNVRKVIASRLSMSKQTIPHYYLSIDCNMDAIIKLRSEFNASLEKSTIDKNNVVKLSVNDFIIKASALACRKVPAVNSSWQDNSIRQYNYVDVSVAVSTDNGLVTPIVKDADIKGLVGISTDVKVLAGKARANKLQPNEFQGGTFTISNLGMFGVKNFSAIINPPQAAILAVGTTETRVVPGKDGQLATAQVMSVTMSCDHRVVDGAVGAQWLAAFKGFIEKPNTMLL